MKDYKKYLYIIAAALCTVLIVGAVALFAGGANNSSAANGTDNVTPTNNVPVTSEYSQYMSAITSASVQEGASSYFSWGNSALTPYTSTHYSLVTIYEFTLSDHSGLPLYGYQSYGICVSQEHRPFLRGCIDRRVSPLYFEVTYTVNGRRSTKRYMLDCADFVEGIVEEEQDFQQYVLSLKPFALNTYYWDDILSEGTINSVKLVSADLPFVVRTALVGAVN